MITISNSAGTIREYATPEPGTTALAFLRNQGVPVNEGVSVILNAELMEGDPAVVDGDFFFIVTKQVAAYVHRFSAYVSSPWTGGKRVAVAGNTREQAMVALHAAYPGYEISQFTKDLPSSAYIEGYRQGYDDAANGSPAADFSDDSLDAEDGEDDLNA